MLKKLFLYYFLLVPQYIHYTVGLRVVWYVKDKYMRKRIPVWENICHHFEFSYLPSPSFQHFETTAMAWEGQFSTL